MNDAAVSQEVLDSFIAKWLGTKGGSERANAQHFLLEFMEALDLPRNLTPAEKGALGDYQFEGPVERGSAAGNKGFIDLYRKGRFVLEAKQSLIPKDKRDRPELFDVVEVTSAAPSGPKYDALMRGALNQARNYAVNLPSDHPWPPFLIVCDVGRAFEIYFDWSGNGRGYSFFPDKQGYRIELQRLAEPDVQTMFRAIWSDPASIDPRARAAEVTRDVAKRLAEVSKWLEASQKQKTAGATSAERSLAIEESALFLMRLLFCMFAEDVGLLPKDSFRGFIEDALDDDRHFQNGLADLWASMGEPHRESRWSWAVKDEVRYFNGGLFASTKTYVLGRADRGELLVAAKADWRRVEPAIFGTLLEQALTPAERAKLGAHYTPRPYVERLVQATIIDVLEAEWAAVQDGVAAAIAAKKNSHALSLTTAFHARLKALRILDPACGTGNFLYVAMELLLRLESEVIELGVSLGGKAEPEIGPHQFLGLELNPRAAVIAELVLWIGWLRWRTANDPAAIPTPVLKRTDSINFGGHAGYDAVLRRKPSGEADTVNPAMPDWPEADFIIGNPPFIGGKDLRDKLGGDYAEALWKANPRVPKSADFVMQWWDRAAYALTRPDNALRRFGFVTTNSITQEFSRRVIANYLGEGGLSLILACPDHPWTKATKDAAAVRIAMTVAEAGNRAGHYIEVTHEAGLDGDNPLIETAITEAVIHADLSIGANVTEAEPLLANEGLSSPGVKLHGAGFIVTPSQAEHLGLGKREGLDRHIRPYRHGRDLLQTSRGVMVIDLYGLDEKEVRTRFPEVYQHILAKVKPERDSNRRDSYKRNWWIFGEPRKDMRPALSGLSRYIATVETAKHRIFQFLDTSILPDNKLLLICSEDAFDLGVLLSKIHLQWTFANCGLIGMANFDAGHVYVKSKCFDPFPFPDASPEQRATIAALAEELDETRKAALAETPGLTMTEIYNLRDLKRSGAALDFATDDRATRARAAIVAKLHDDLDAAVAAAYGWPASLAPSEIITRLVALNAQRAAEEKAGTVRWLRPDYQIPRFAKD
ncbi:MAG: DNA methyltransferase [Pseudomonadota bacterium]